MLSPKGTRLNIYRLVATALFTALVFVSNYISFSFTTPIGPTRIHIANTLCLLSGILLGPLSGGAAAGIGSMLYDFTNPLYISSAPITLLNKFIMAFVCGLIVKKSHGRKNQQVFKLLGAFCGAFSYVFLYISKSYIEARIVQLLEPQAAWAALLVSKLPASLTNAVIAIVLSVPLSAVLERSLRGKSVYERFINNR